MLYGALPQNWRHSPPRSSRSWIGPLLCSSSYCCLPFTLPKQGDWVKTCSWARLCPEEVLLWCVLYPGRGISVSLGLNPAQREWDPLSGSKGQAEGQEKRCLTPAVHSPPAQSCPFTMCLTWGTSIFWDIDEDSDAVAQPLLCVLHSQIIKRVLPKHVLFFL